MNDITHTEVNGYLIPDLILPDEKEYDIGKYGLMRRNYLKNNRKGFYTSLLTSGKLHVADLLFSELNLRITVFQ